jgi:hypothetical protein
MAASDNPSLPNGVQALRPVTHQNVAYTTTAGTITNAVASRVVRVVCTTAAYVRIGLNPTADTSDMYMAAEVAEYFRIEPGHKVSARQVAAGGTLHVTEMD